MNHEVTKDTKLLFYHRGHRDINNFLLSIPPIRERGKGKGEVGNGIHHPSSIIHYPFFVFRFPFIGMGHPSYRFGLLYPFSESLCGLCGEKKMSSKIRIYFRGFVSGERVKRSGKRNSHFSSFFYLVSWLILSKVLFAFRQNLADSIKCPIDLIFGNNKGRCESYDLVMCLFCKYAKFHKAFTVRSCRA